MKTAETIRLDTILLSRVFLFHRKVKIMTGILPRYLSNN